MTDESDPPPQWPRWRYLFASACLVALSFVLLCWSSRGVSAVTQDLAKGNCRSGWLVFVPCNGLTRLQLASDRVTAVAVLDAIDSIPAIKAAAVRSVQLDYFLILSYVTFLGFFGAAVASLKGPRKVPWVRRTLLVVVLLQGVAGLLDGVENIGLLAMLSSAAYDIPDSVPRWTFVVSAIKWWLIAIGLVVPLLALAGTGLLARSPAESS